MTLSKAMTFPHAVSISKKGLERDGVSPSKDDSILAPFHHPHPCPRRVLTFPRTQSRNMPREKNYEDYIESWRDYLQKNSGKTVGSAWVFAAKQGICNYEGVMKEWLYTQMSEPEQLFLDKVNKITEKKIGGFVLYGYGNALREKRFIEHCVDKELSPEVIMYDSSFVYHKRAQSASNPLREADGFGRIKAFRLDIEDIKTNREFILKQRDKMRTDLPVLHLFLGNYAGNVEEYMLQNVMKSYTRSGDYVILDHGVYGSNFFKNGLLDHTSELAQEAIAELFSIEPDEVKTKTINEKSKKYVEISFNYDDSEINFKSIMRREFDPAIKGFDLLVHDGDARIKYALFRKTERCP